MTKYNFKDKPDFVVDMTNKFNNLMAQYINDTGIRYGNSCAIINKFNIKIVNDIYFVKISFYRCWYFTCMILDKTNNVFTENQTQISCEQFNNYNINNTDKSLFGNVKQSSVIDFLLSIMNINDKITEINYDDDNYFIIN